MCGHTAAGKTTIGKSLCEHFDIELVSEGKIKRAMVTETYTYENSLDEGLRDRGYKEAIRIAIEKLKTANHILLDASFHKKFRRDWVKEEMDKSDLDIITIWIYVYCPNKDKVVERIQQRKVAKKEADNQADSMAIYEHIVSTFDPLRKEDMWDNTAAFYINTDSLMLEQELTKNLVLPDEDNQIEKTRLFVEEYLKQ